MPTKIQSSKTWLPLLYAATAAVLTLSIWITYSAALPGHFLFDDVPNLQSLADVKDWLSGLVFAFTGESGPLGRPLALATFALQSDAWPENPSAMLRVNLVIHVLAVWTCLVLSLGLIRLRPLAGDDRGFWIAFAVAALWGLSPFLATTHLMIIQRMTSLAGLFVLAGLAAFVWAHVLAEGRPILARSLLIGTGAATILATLSKENGALLPLLALAILWLWIPKERRLSRRLDRGLIALLVILPSFIILAYLASQLPGIIEQGYGPGRYFTPAERLMSQPAILLDYVQQLFLPRAFAVSPFMDRIPAPKGWLDPPITLIALLLWLSAAGIAIRLRHARPVLLFGLVFFLAGHLLESSFFGLELYFAHRNYVPAFGLYFAFVMTLAALPAPYHRLMAFGLTAYILLFGIILLQVTSAWSQTHVSARFWVAQNPYSERATQVLVNQFLQEGDFVGARRAFDALAKRSPTLAMIQIQRTAYCIGEESDFPGLLSEVNDRLRTAMYGEAAAAELFKAALADPSRRCKGRDHAALAAMAGALLENPVYAETPTGRAYLLATKAIAEEKAGNTPGAIELLMEAFETHPALDIATYGAISMANLNQYERAQAFLNEALAKAPDHPFKRIVWSRHLEDTRDAVNASRRIKSTRQEP